MPVSLTKVDYGDHLEGVKATYEPRITAFLNRIGDYLTEDGFTVGPIVDLCADSYQWGRDVRLHLDSPKEHSVFVEIQIVEQRMHEGEGWGVSFHLDITAWGGPLVGGYAPHNYTPSWVVDSRDPDAVQQRWDEFTAIQLDTISDALVTHYQI